MPLVLYYHNDSHIYTALHLSGTSSCCHSWGWSILCWTITAWPRSSVSILYRNRERKSPNCLFTRPTQSGPSRGRIRSRQWVLSDHRTDLITVPGPTRHPHSTGSSVSFRKSRVPCSARSGQRRLTKTGISATIAHRTPRAILRKTTFASWTRTSNRPWPSTTAIQDSRYTPHSPPATSTTLQNSLLR